MWLLKLQYEFYNPRFYDAERNFSHQGQRQEKWNWISEMGLGRARGSEWQRQPTELISWSLLLSPELWGDQLQNVTFAAFSAARSQVSTATEVGLNHFPSLQPHFQPPHPKSYFPVKSSEVVCFIFWGSLLLLKEHGDPSSGPWSSTKALRLGHITELHASVSSSTKQRTCTSSLGSDADLLVHDLIPAQRALRIFGAWRGKWIPKLVSIFLFRKMKG